MDKKSLAIWYVCASLYCVWMIILIFNSIKERKEQHEINNVVKNRINELDVILPNRKFKFKREKS